MAKIVSKNQPPRREKSEGSSKSVVHGKSTGGSKVFGGEKSSGGTKSFGGSKPTGGAKTMSGSKPVSGSNPKSGSKPSVGEKSTGFEKFSDSTKFNSPVKAMTDQLILELLLEDVFEEPTDYGAAKIQSFKKAGVQSAQPGVLVTMEDGSAYEIMIKKVK